MRAQHIQQTMTIGERLAPEVVGARKLGFPVTEEVIEERRSIAAKEQDGLRAHDALPGVPYEVCPITPRTTIGSTPWPSVWYPLSRRTERSSNQCRDLRLNETSTNRIANEACRRVDVQLLHQFG